MRGGIPRTVPAAITTVGRWVQFPALSENVVFSVDVAAKLYFTEEDFTLDTNGFPLVPTSQLNVPIEDRGVWLRSVSGTANVLMLVALRKG